MLTRTLCMLLTIMLVAGAGLPPALAKSKEEKRAEYAAKVRNEIAKLGVGTDTRVEVKLRDRTKLKGWLSSVDEEGFIVTDSKTGAATSVTYPQVAKVKGNNLSTGAAIVIGAAIGAGITLLTIFLIIASLD